jgi:acyl-CoA dehydrogenase
VDFSVSDELAAIGESLIRFIDREVIPLEEKNRPLLANERRLFSEDGRFAPEVLELRKVVRMRSAEQGFYTMFGATDLGGGGLGTIEAVYVQELLNSRYGPERPLIQTLVLPSPFTNGLSPVLRTLQPAILNKYLPRIANGEKTLCFGLSEPDAGSDVFAMRTRASRDGEAWILNGTKQWITNAPYANYAMIFAVTDADAAARRKGGITGFFVDARSPGFAVPSVIPVMGHLGAEIGIVTMDNVRVPDDHRLGEVGAGLKVAMTGVNTGRLSMAASCVGLARWALAGC